MEFVFYQIQCQSITRKSTALSFSCTWCDQHRRTTDSPVSVYEVCMAEGGWLGRSGSLDSRRWTTRPVWLTRGDQLQTHTRQSLEEIDSTANTHRSSQSCHKPINTFASYIAFFLFDQFYLKYEQLCECLKSGDNHHKLRDNCHEPEEDDRELGDNCHGSGGHHHEPVTQIFTDPIVK